MVMKREEQVTPLRLRSGELSEKLMMVRSQLENVRSIRERSVSLTSLDINNRSMSSVQDLEQDNPPPYNEHF